MWRLIINKDFETHMSYYKVNKDKNDDIVVEIAHMSLTYRLALAFHF